MSPLLYVTHVGYFDLGGFTSLRREHFKASTAKDTPIPYCKMLLNVEAGKGTNVLFGDGHIEWVTAEELDRLKARPRP